MQPAVLSPRLTRSFVQRIAASPGQVFPLLCPEMEKHWLPDWDYRMIHSRSGIAERGAVFATPHAEGNTIWVVTSHDPPRRIEFTRWQPDGLVVALDISLGRHDGGETAVCISYTYTAIDARGAAAIDALDEPRWRDTMVHWERSMNAWFDKQRSA